MVYRTAPPGPQALRTIALVDGEVVGLASALEERGVAVSAAKAGRVEVQTQGTRYGIALGDGRVAVRAHRSLWQRLTFAAPPPVPADLLLAIHAVLESSEDCRLRGWTNERFVVPAAAPDAPVGPERTWATFRSEDFPIETFENESGSFVSYDCSLGTHVARALRTALAARGHEVGPIEEEESSSWFPCVIGPVQQRVCVCTVGTGEWDVPEEPEYSVAVCEKNPWNGGSTMAAVELHAVLEELDVEDLCWWDMDAEHEAVAP